MRNNLIATLLFWMALCGCTAAATHFSIRVGAYASEQGLCVEDGKTRAEVDACRAGVKADYKTLLAQDAGDASHD